MLRVALISPCTLGPDSNPGWYMITAGVMHLVQLAAAPRPVSFVLVDMLQDNQTHWNAAATCHVAIMCGNPRFTLSDSAWWEHGIWHRLLGLQVAGIRVIDGWAGAAYSIGAGKSIAEIGVELLAHPRNAECLQYARLLHGNIARDPLTQWLYQAADVPAVQLPCSSWWAPRDAPLQERSRHCISVMALANNRPVEAAVRLARVQLEQEAPVDVVASTWNDYLWARAAGIEDVQLISDPFSLMRAYRRYAKVLTMRVHAAIPAARCGAAVHLVAIDTRAQAAEPFGIPITSMHEFEQAPTTWSAECSVTDDAVVPYLKEMLC